MPKSSQAQGREVASPIPKEVTSTDRFPCMEAEKHAAQLASLMEVLYSDGFVNFESLPNEDRNNILWLVSDLARAIIAGGVSHE